MRANTAILCFVLLACVHVCSSIIIPRCQCVKLSKSVKNPSNINRVLVIKPRPYCNKEEVIIMMKNQDLLCLDPKEKFTQAILYVWESSKQTAVRRSTTPAKTVPRS